MKHETTVELFYDNTWNAAPILTRDEITINRGNPSSASLTIDNTSKDYSPRSVAGSLYGKIGQNTPIRILCDLDPLHTDDFARTESNGWGFSPTAGGYFSAWTSGGSVADFGVSGGAGRHTVLAAAGYRMSYLVGQVNTDDADVECYVTCPLPTGNELEPTICLAVQDLSNYLMFRARIATSGAVQLAIRTMVGGVETLLTTVSTGLTHAAATPLHLRARMSCGELQFKAWQGATQPSTWTATVIDTTVSCRGGVGFRSGRAGGNTNVAPVFAWDGVTITIGRTRFVGEVTSWVPERPIKGSGWTRIQATGVRQRLGRGVDPLQSSARRYYSDMGASHYWPMEPGSQSTNLLDDTRPLQYTGTNVEYGTFDGPAGSDKGPKFLLFDDRPPVTQILAPVNGTSTSWVVNFWFRASPGSYSDVFFTPVVDFCEVTTDGTIARWTIEALSYPAGNQFEVTATGYDTAGDIISGLSAVVDMEILDGAWHMITLQCEQLAGPFGTVGLTIDAGAGAGAFSSTYANGKATGIYLPKRLDPSNVADVGMMHLAYFNSLAAASYYDLWYAGVGWTGEEAGTRFLRICAEQGVLAFVDGTATDTASMGPQRLKRFLEHMDEIERTDDAWVYEPRAVLGLGMKTGQAKLNQVSVLTLDYAGGMIAPVLKPVVGDAHIRNDVTASNPGSGERRVEVLTGPNGIAEVGRYQTRVDVNRGDFDGPDDDALLDAAGWRTNKGTFDGTWYGSVTVDLDAAPSMIPAVAAADIGDLITLENLPEDEALEAVEHLVASYTETIGSHRRRITFNLEPGEPYRVGLIGSTTGDTRDFLGWLDTDGSTTVSTVAPSATTFQAATPSGPLWSTVADDYPQDLIVGGQRVSVSACSGASSPQTFTVQVGGSQVVYSIPAGQPINVANPVILTQ